MAQPTAFTFSASTFIPGTLGRAEQVDLVFSSVAVGFQILAVQGVDSGTANAYVVATSGGQDGAYSDGLIVEFKAKNANTGASTIAVDSGAVVGLTNSNGQSLVAGAISANTWYRCLYNSTYSAFTVIAPTSLVTTSNTISAAAPTYKVGLVAAGGVSTACAPIDVTFALDQSIAPTWTGAHIFGNTVTFNSTVSFATGLTLTGAASAYALTLDGSSSTGHSFGLRLAAGTNGSDAAVLISNQAASTNFFEIDGAGNVLVGTPTGGGQGVGTINAQGLFVNGAAVKTTSISSANPSASVGLSAVNGSAATFMTSDSAPALSQAIAPTWTGAHTFTPSSAVTAATINAAVNTLGISIVGNTNTINTALLSIVSGQGSGFSSGALIQAGTTSGDNAINIVNAAATATFFTVRGDGEILCGQDLLGLTLRNSAGTAVGRLRTVKGWLGSGVDVTDLAIGAIATMNLYAGNNVSPSLQLLGLTAPTIQGYGPTAAGLVDLTPDTGSFTITYTGFTTTVTGTAVWARIGNLVLLYLPAATATSNSASMTGTGLPAAIQNVRTQLCLVPIENNSGTTTGSASVAAGTITFGATAAASGGFMTSNTKGVPVATCISYLLN